MATKITARPKKTVSNPSISRTSSNTDCTMTAKWKVGSALTSTKNNRRATCLRIVWSVKYADANGTNHTREKIVDKGIGTTTHSFNPMGFTDSKGTAWTQNDFWPRGPRRLKSVSFMVYAGNVINKKEGYAKKGAGATYSFGSPTAPTVSALEHDADSGEVFFTIDAYDGKSLVKAADLKGTVSGRRMEVWTTLPGIQLYGGNHFSGFPGKGGMRYNKAAGLALETQFYPDAPHHPAWPQPTVKAGETQRSRTEFRFFTI